MAMVCKTCGAFVNREGNYYVCEFCKNKWEIDSGNDVNAVERANAWSALRDGDFERAAELFENIIAKETNNHEAYWGRALALAGIVYVTDLNENKKVPTCNNITEESFINNKDVQKAISLAPTDIAGSYKIQAEYIEKVRIEWLEKASKEPEYDVFISFKDSDRENGIERTQDSIDAQDLYNALIAEGYKVFFSRISLRDKISEQYEPYIYNAIKTAKVMIVFGEKADYFKSVWIKNEWSRFKARIEKNEKHKNSLVVVYKNMSPADLPIVLKTRQCLNASDITFLSDLTRHIRRVVDESKRNVQLERIEITGGQISKKATSLQINSVQTREIGVSAIAETDITEKQTLELIQTYLDNSMWQEALRMIDDVLFNNPNCAEAILSKIMATKNAANIETLINKIESFNENDFASIEKVLSCSSIEYAEKVLEMLYKSEKNASDDKYNKILQIILPFSFSNRQKMIDATFEGVIERTKYGSFKLLLNTLDSSDVDQYIKYNFKYAMRTKKLDIKFECINKILNVESGNVDALREHVYIGFQTNVEYKKLVDDFETLLKYAKNINKEVISCLEWLCNNLSTKTQCDFVKQLLRYYTDEISTIKDYLKRLSYIIINKGFFEEAEYFLNLMLTINANDIDAYWGICLVKLRAKSETDICNSNILLQDIPEFNKYMTFVSEDRRKECFYIIKNQKLKQHRKKCNIVRNLVGSHGVINISDLFIYSVTSGGHCKNIFGQNRIKRIIKSDFQNIACEFIDGNVSYQGRRFNSPRQGLVKLDSTIRNVYGLYEDGTLRNRYGEVVDNEYSDRDLRGKFRYIGYKFRYNCDGVLICDLGKELRKRKDIVDIVEVWYSLYVLRADGRVELDRHDRLYEEEYIVQICTIDDVVLFLSMDGNIYVKGKVNARISKYISGIKSWKEIVFLVVGSIDKAKKLFIIVGVDKYGKVHSVWEGYDNIVRIDEVDLKIFNNFDTIVEDYEASIRKYSKPEKQSKSEVQAPTTAKKQGCYIATCVYGSYDCPEVWVLRRFRDNILRTSWYGNLFVKLYYFISPKLVKKFGTSRKFCSMWKGVLDKMVNKLKLKGFETTPYQDK